MKYLVSISTLLAFSTIQPAWADEWTGVYGTAALGLSLVEVNGDQGIESDDDLSVSGQGGLGLGASMDYGRLVLGLEGDISAMGNKNHLTMKNTITADEDWFATARLRAGMPTDDTLYYATGGIAAMGVEAHAEGSDRETLAGWTIGAGMEHRISERLAFKVEGLYMNFEEKKFETGSFFIMKLEPNLAIARMGLTYGF